jgi:hypothetical protein
MVRVSSTWTLHDTKGHAKSAASGLARMASPAQPVPLIVRRYIAHRTAGVVGVGRPLRHTPGRPSHSHRGQRLHGLILLAILLLLQIRDSPAQSTAPKGAAFVSYAIKLRQNALYRIDPNVVMSPSTASTASDSGSGSLADRAAILKRRFGLQPWKVDIVTTVFWIGERPCARNPVPNDRSSWDSHWCANYGGYDNPRRDARRNFVPIRFTPHQNPFYIALPYNDVDKGHTKPEASQVIPWFKRSFQRDGQSVLKGRWIAIRKGEKVCYAQWEDCGPFRTDHWQYVFGNERPKPNLNGGAGLDVSPAVRDYLGLTEKDLCDWKFVESSQIPDGPWALHLDKSTLVSTRLPDRGPFDD